MKKILIQFGSQAYDNNAIFKNMDINRLNAGWFEMKKQLESMGYELVTADNNNFTDCEGIIFFNYDSIYRPMSLGRKVANTIRKLLGKKTVGIYPTRNLYDEAVKAELRNKIIFIIWEAKAVCKENFDPKVWSKFDKILTWNDDLLKDSRFRRFYIPMEGNVTLDKPVPFNTKKLVVNISHNKHSSYKAELYTARRKTVEYFDKYYPKDFDLYGTRWNKPSNLKERLMPWTVRKYATFRGHAKNKFDTMSQYKFNLCYENISDTKGYVCDKIFTSFHAKSVPIYWGASNIEEYIDTDTFIDRRKFKNDAELAKHITSIDENRYNTYLEAADRFMKSEQYNKFKPENYGKPIIEAMGLKKLK